MENKKNKCDGFCKHCSTNRDNRLKEASKSFNDKVNDEVNNKVSDEISSAKKSFRTLRLYDTIYIVDNFLGIYTAPNIKEHSIKSIELFSDKSINIVTASSKEINIPDSATYDKKYNTISVYMEDAINTLVDMCNEEIDLMKKIIDVNTK